MPSKKIKARRDVLYEEDPHCRDCGCLTRRPEDCDLAVGKRSPGNMATLEHKYSRMNPKRWAPRNARMAMRDLYTLLCSTCNQKRAKKELREVPKEVKQMVNSGMKMSEAWKKYHAERKQQNTQMKEALASVVILWKNCS